MEKKMEKNPKERRKKTAAIKKNYPQRNKS